MRASECLRGKQIGRPLSSAEIFFELQKCGSLNIISGNKAITEELQEETTG